MAIAAFQKLAKRLNLTDPDPEPYILSRDEEREIISKAIDQKRQHLAWKFKGAGFSEQEIKKKLSEVDWNAKIDREKLLQTANSIKHQNLWHHEQREKEKTAEAQRLRDLKTRCDAKHMFKLMKWTSQNGLGKQLIVNEHNKHLITTLCYFLSEDPRLETELGYSLNKGLLIRGVSGLGKTHLVRCLENNELNPVLVLSMLEITDEVSSNGEYQINLGGQKVIYLDDVGTEEPTITYYGTRVSFFKNFIELVYLKNRVFNKLMISTNNSFKQLEEKYGFRVRSRIKDMFNVVDVTGEDMRG